MKCFDKIFLLAVLSVIRLNIYSQPVVNFLLPDSSCVSAPINITNLTSGGSTYYWTFCSGNPNSDPTGVNIGNPGNLLNVPTYITLVQDGNTYYSFISSQLVGIIRYNHGSSFSHYPVSWTNLGKFGILSNSIEGIQVKNDNGNWYGFVCDNSSLIRLDFGNSLANTPTAFSVGTFPVMVHGHGLQILKDGTTWFGFATCSVGNNLVRFNFGNALINIPYCEDLGNLASFNTPTQLVTSQVSNLWYILIIQGGMNNLCRISFGTSLLNSPTGENLGNVGGLPNTGGLTIVNDCNSLNGYFTEYLSNGLLGKLSFDGGIAGTVTGQIIGNIGNLNLPHSFSEIFRQNDTLFAYITDRGSNSLTRLTFPSCSNASIPSSTLFNPPPFSYNQPGTYNVRLVVNEGLPDQVNLCKTIVISPVPSVNLGPDRSICPGTSTVLDAGAGFTTYLWSTGATTRLISISTAGTYSVTVTMSGCTASDAVNVSLNSVTPVNLGTDTLVCQGQSVTFDAGSCAGCTYLWTDLGTGFPVGTSQTFTTFQTGTYMVTVTDALGCHAMDTVQLSTSPPPVVKTNPLYDSICSGGSTNILLAADIPGTVFSWTATGSSGSVTGYAPGNGESINQVLTNSNSIPETVTYTITPSFGTCSGIPVQYIVTVIPVISVSISIAGSLTNVCDGVPVTITATPANGGINPFYQWKVNGINTGPHSPSFTFTPSNNDAITCVLTSDLPCNSGSPALSNLVTMTVNPNLLGSISISADANPVCSGILVNFTAIPGNEGTLPIYQWKVNGIDVGMNSSNYSYIPVSGDRVKCVLNSNENCISGNPFVSNSVEMTVNANLMVSISIAASNNPVCEGAPITFTASSLNAGTNPSYQWKVNGLNTGLNSQFYTYTPSAGDLVSCALTSNLLCTVNNPATSNDIPIILLSNPTVIFTPCFDTISTLNAKPIKLKGGIPLGGIYSGTGVNSFMGIFTPSLAGVGSHTITYSYTNAALCSATKSISILALPSSILPCGTNLVDPRDNHFYPTVQIGSQCWMASNLNFGTKILSSQVQRDNCLAEKYCMNDNSTNCTNSGGLYQWDELMLFEVTPASQGICPPAWHIPGENDWNLLFTNWTSDAFAGSPLKYSGYSGFNALLAGINLFNKSWDFKDFATIFWSSTPYTSIKAWAHAMNQIDPSVAHYPSSRANAFSVRCIKD
jgi:uncharacterized protein (TIGR02145 family)